MRTSKKFSIVIPVYNEKDTIAEILELVSSAPLPAVWEREIVVVDDGSTDGSREIIKQREGWCRVILHDKNQGKGAAVRAGLAAATGDYVIIQDADLEYNPEEYPVLLQPILDNRADIVYGSRFLGNRPHRALFFWHYFGNWLITLFSNICTNLNLTDVETGYKCFSRVVCDVLIQSLSSNRFGVELEITAIVAWKKFRVFEVGISYFGRTYEEGKKITWQDGLAALWHIFYFNFIKRYS